MRLKPLENQYTIGLLKQTAIKKNKKKFFDGLQPITKG